MEPPAPFEYIEPTTLLSYIATSIAGSMVAQMASLEEVDLLTLSGNFPVLQRYAAALAQKGIDPQLLAQHTLMSLQVIFACEHNAAIIKTTISHILWHTLGDPESGPPPEIYRQASDDVHAYFISLLSDDREMLPV